MIVQTINGKLLDNFGKPIINQFIKIYKVQPSKPLPQDDFTRKAPYEIVITDENGNWKATLHPGRYTAEFSRNYEVVSKDFVVAPPPSRTFGAQDYRAVKES